MPLDSAEGEERPTVLARHSMSAILWSGERTECTQREGGEGDTGDHELGSRWQISIQFIKTRT